MSNNATPTLPVVKEGDTVYCKITEKPYVVVMYPVLERTDKGEVAANPDSFWGVYPQDYPRWLNGERNMTSFCLKVTNIYF